MEEIMLDTTAGMEGEDGGFSIVGLILKIIIMAVMVVTGLVLVKVYKKLKDRKVIKG